MNTTLLLQRSGLTANESAVVSEFVNHVNSEALSPLVSLFAVDAHVNDQLRNFWGLDSITDWLKHEIVGDQVRMAVRSVRKHYDVVILEVEMSGDFAVAGALQPVVVDCHFTLHGAKIIRLLMLLARQDSAEPEVRQRR